MSGSWPFTALSLLVGIAGWYYLFYSRAAHRLGEIEGNVVNRRRVRLRRANGLMLIVLAALLYVGTHGIDPRERPRAFVIVWLSVMFVLIGVVALALMDIRLTHNLRRRSQRPGGKQ